MSDPILSAIILAIQGVLVALITRQGRRLTAVKKDAAETREQVSNNHIDAAGNPINLREEQDRRHEENRKLILDVEARVTRGFDAIIQTVDREFSMLAQAVNVNTRRIDNIEDTIPPKELPRE